MFRQSNQWIIIIRPGKLFGSQTKDFHLLGDTLLSIVLDFEGRVWRQLLIAIARHLFDRASVELVDFLGGKFVGSHRPGQRINLHVEAF